jgi:hypothetical protein
MGKPKKLLPIDEIDLIKKREHLQAQQQQQMPLGGGRLRADTDSL